MQWISDSYFEAREIFRTRAESAGWRLEAHPLKAAGPGGETLTIDIAVKGSVQPRRAVVVSSGTHGVEGFFGSGVQRAFLERPEVVDGLEEDAAMLLVHAVNPYGFAWVRRVNEDNVDLNRNFLLDGDHYEGCPDGYHRMDPLLNTPTPPGGFEAFLPRAIWNIVRHGMPALKSAVATGQYAYPKGLFYGGSQASQSQQILSEALPRLLPNTERVIHIDFHTGLGKWGTYTLGVSDPVGSPKVRRLQEAFGEPAVEALDPSGTLYVIRGVLGDWCQELLPDTQYDCVLAEFGTVHILKVIAALRAENRAHHYGEPGTSSTQAAKQALRDAFAPHSESWEREVVAKGLRLIEQAIQAQELMRCAG